jgi:hypothetical protein
MKKIAIIIVLYLIGVVLAYDLGKTSVKAHNARNGVKDTRQDKVFVSAMSLGSWCSVVAIPIADFITLHDPNEEIKW